MPFAVSATTLSGRSAASSTKDRTWAANAPSRSSDVEPPSGRAAGGTPIGGHPLDLLEARVLADGTRPRQAELEPVVLGGVVRRREHGAGGVEAARGEVHEVGRGQAEVDDVEALRSHAVRERSREPDAGGPHVPTDEHAVGASCRPGHEHRERLADGPGDALIELVGGDAADVVGLEDRVEVGHRALTLLAAPQATGDATTVSGASS